MVDIDKNKYLVPFDLTAYKFAFVIRKRIKLSEKDCVYFFVNGKYLIKGNETISEMYEKYKDNDGFLYIQYTNETTLGWSVLGL